MIVDDDTGCAGVLGTVPTYALVKTDPVASTYHAVGAQLTGTYYVANASSCAAYSPGGAGEPFRLFAVDPTGLPLTTWQPATLAYDP